MELQKYMRIRRFSNMKKMRLLSKICISVISTTLVMVVALSVGLKSDTKVVKAVENNLQSMRKMLENNSGNSEVMMSSNPYDYIKNNKYYDQIVSFGIDAVPVLEEQIESGEVEGLCAYLSALAIEDITSCKIGNKPNYEWDSAPQFSTKWKEYVENISCEMESILSDENTSMQGKIKKIKDYGIFGVLVVDDLEKNAKWVSKFETREINMLKNYVKEMNVSKQDKEKIKDYLKLHK